MALLTYPSQFNTAEGGPPDWGAFGGYANKIRFAIIPNSIATKPDGALPDADYRIYGQPVYSGYRYDLPYTFDIPLGNPDIRLMPGFGYGQGLPLALQPIYPQWEKWQT